MNHLKPEQYDRLDFLGTLARGVDKVCRLVSMRYCSCSVFFLNLFSS